MSGLFAGTALERPVTCEVCGQAIGACRCPRGRDGKVLLSGAQEARVRREKRGNKVVTVISGITKGPNASAPELGDLVKMLKGKLATGGTVSSEVAGAKRVEMPTIELQGDHRDRVVDMLKGMGYPTKASGG
jgi:translation initiation factor 1